MDPQNPFLSEDHIEFKREVRRVLEAEAPREKVREWDKGREYPYGLFKKISELGWTALGIPEQYGGAAADPLYMCIVTEELGRYSSDVASGYIITMWGGLDIAKWGTQDQCATYLPALVNGDVRFSFSLTEPNSGSDAAAMRTTAKRDGDGWVINGQKIFSTAADKKDNVILLAARTSDAGPKQHGISLFLLPNDTPGLTIKPMNLLARRILGTTELFMDDVRLGPESLLGPVDKGWDCLLEHLAIERMTGACAYLGNAQGAVDLAIDYASNREQFGRPIGKFQAIQHMIADMQVEVDAARLLTYRVATLVANDIPCNTQASMAKLYASEASFKVASKGMQILGGYAQSPDYDMERYFRDGKQSMVGGGSSEIQRNIIARALGL